MTQLPALLSAFIQIFSRTLTSFSYCESQNSSQYSSSDHISTTKFSMRITSFEQLTMHVHCIPKCSLPFQLPGHTVYTCWSSFWQACPDPFLLICSLSAFLPVCICAHILLIKILGREREKGKKKRKEN